MIKKIIELIKDIYLKISFACCCRSKCQIQVGRPENSNDSNVNSKAEEQVSNI